jgi:hypothetical protein
VALRGSQDDRDQVLALPLPELARLVLTDARERGQWNWRSWLLDARRVNPQDEALNDAFAEAWAFLLNHGLVVWDSTSLSADAFVISRAGQRFLGTPG